jgi:hypothetical protein
MYYNEQIIIFSDDWELITIFTMWHMYPLFSGLSMLAAMHRLSSENLINTTRKKRCYTAVHRTSPQMQGNCSEGYLSLL